VLVTDRLRQVNCCFYPMTLIAAAATARVTLRFVCSASEPHRNVTSTYSCEVKGKVVHVCAMKVCRGTRGKKLKVKILPIQTTKALRVSRIIALPFHDLGA
jgi:hypothetical protein